MHKIVLSLVLVSLFAACALATTKQEYPLVVDEEKSTLTFDKIEIGNDFHWLLTFRIVFNRDVYVVDGNPASGTPKRVCDMTDIVTYDKYRATVAFTNSSCAASMTCTDESTPVKISTYRSQSSGLFTHLLTAIGNEFPHEYFAWHMNGHMKNPHTHKKCNELLFFYLTEGVFEDASYINTIPNNVVEAEQLTIDFAPITGGSCGLGKVFGGYHASCTSATCHFKQISSRVSFSTPTPRLNLLNYTRLESVITRVQELENEFAEAPSQEMLESLRTTVSAINNADAFIGADVQVREFVLSKYANVTTIADGESCHYEPGTQEFLTDAACNVALQNVTCPVKNEVVQARLPVVDSLLPMIINTKCKHPLLISALYSSYADALHAYEDALSVQTHAHIIMYHLEQILNGALAEIDKPCMFDMECKYGQFCHLAHKRCKPHVDSVPSVIASYIADQVWSYQTHGLRLWLMKIHRIPVTSDKDEFASALAQRLVSEYTASICVPGSQASVADYDYSITTARDTVTGNWKAKTTLANETLCENAQGSNYDTRVVKASTFTELDYNTTTDALGNARLSICGIDLVNTPYLDVSSPPLCIATGISSSDVCTGRNHTWDSANSRCVVNATTAAACYSSARCAAALAEIQTNFYNYAFNPELSAFNTGCYQSYCYNEVADNDDCTAVVAAVRSSAVTLNHTDIVTKFLDANFQNNTAYKWGACLRWMSANTEYGLANDSSTCVRSVHMPSFHEGRLFIQPRYNTQADCENGYDANPLLRGFQNNDDTIETTPVCDQPVPACVAGLDVSGVREKTLCYNPWIKTQTACVDGIWTNNLCRHALNRTLCVAAGYEFYDARDFTKEQCDAGTYPDANAVAYLGHAWTNYAIPRNATECAAAAGSCNDDDLERTYFAGSNVVRNTGICVRFPTFIENSDIPKKAVEPVSDGTVGKFNTYTRMGYVVNLATHSKSNCLAGHASNRWIDRAYNQSSCLAQGYTCTQEDSVNGMGRLFAESTCSTCGGTYKPIYQWSTGKTSASVRLNAAWLPKKWESVNKMGLSFSINAFSHGFKKSAAAYVNSLLMNNVNKLLALTPLMKVVACDCNATSSATSLECFRNTTDYWTVNITSQLVDPIDPQPIATVLTFNEPFNSLRNTDLEPVAVHLNRIPNAAFAIVANKTQTVHPVNGMQRSLLSTDDEDSGIRVAAHAVSKAVVLNDYDQVVGEVIGDAIMIQTDTSSITFDAELCLPMTPGAESEIDNASNFTKRAVAAVEETENTMFLRVYTTDVTLVGNQLCFNLTYVNSTTSRASTIQITSTLKTTSYFAFAPVLVHPDYATMKADAPEESSSSNNATSWWAILLYCVAGVVVIAIVSAVVMKCKKPSTAKSSYGRVNARGRSRNRY